MITIKVIIIMTMDYNHDDADNHGSSDINNNNEKR